MSAQYFLYIYNQSPTSNKQENRHREEICTPLVMSQCKSKRCEPIQNRQKEETTPIAFHFWQLKLQHQINEPLHLPDPLNSQYIKRRKDRECHVNLAFQNSRQKKSITLKLQIFKKNSPSSFLIAVMQECACFCQKCV